MAGQVCWRCGAALKDVPKPITRLSQCKACRADLHVCRLCKFYNPKLHDRCDNELAEPAREVDIANFCGYFVPKTNAFVDDEKSKSDAAMDELKALFGGGDETKLEIEAEAEKEASSESEYDEAKAKFDSLFKP